MLMTAANSGGMVRCSAFDAYLWEILLPELIGFARIVQALIARALEAFNSEGEAFE